LVLSTLGFTESYKIVDTKLVLGYLTVATAAGAYFLDKKMKFVDSLPYLKLLLVLYAILSTLTWLHQRYVVKNTVYTGTKNKQVVEIGGDVDKFIPEYKLTITVKSEGSKGVSKNVGLPFTEVFDKFGNLHDGELAAWIKEQIKTNEKDK
jgi:signal peptidase complex subunit 2